MQVLIDRTTRVVTGYGTFNAPPPDPNSQIVTVADALLSKIQQAGAKVLNATGDDITVTPPPVPVPVPDPSVAKRAAAITALKAAAGGAGAVATLAQNILDLSGIT